MAVKPVGASQASPRVQARKQSLLPEAITMNSTLDKEKAKQILSKYDYFLFDCDGVLWLGNHLLPYVKETLQLLKDAKKTIIFVTNNSTKSRTEYLKKFEKLGISGIKKEEIFGSSYASAIYVLRILKLPKDKKIWVLGEKGIEEELHELGYSTIGGSDPAYFENGEEFNPEDPRLHELDDSVGAVVAGLTFNVNYLKLSITTQYLLKDEKSLPFIATNIDSTFPMKGKLLVGAGSIINSVAYASGRDPDAICGKPNPSMMESIMADNPGLKARPSSGLMIGDRLNTDMKFGRLNGLDTLLVFTGIEKKESLLNLSNNERPTFCAEKLGDLYCLTQNVSDTPK